MTILKNIREIVLDTETTGLEYENGDRIVDIGCVELVNHIQTGNVYHVYVNPERIMGNEAIEISGITNEFLVDKPLFKDIADEFLDFVRDSPLVIHNAKFDISFLNSELERIGKPLFKLEEAIDTLAMARKKYPGSLASLDALCRRFNVDTSIRSKHGALIDCYLLAEVYINLLGGLQSDLLFSSEEKPSNTGKNNTSEKSELIYEKRYFLPSEEEIRNHKEFLKTLTDPKWNTFLFDDNTGGNN